MPKQIYQNEKMKRRYFDYCKFAKGFSLKTMKKIEGSIFKYDEFIKNEDYKKFNSEGAKGFRKWLETNKGKNKRPLSKSSQFHTLRLLKAFFLWLSQQPSYKSKITLDSIEYLSLSRADRRIATSSSMPKFPTLEYIKKMTSFEIHDDIDLRDRALISFTALSGMRDLAIISLPLNCYDKEKQAVIQDPRFGVKTKFSKTIHTKLVIFDNILLSYLNEWLELLSTKYFFTGKDPLFPSTEMGIKSEIEQSFVPTGISNRFWSDAGAMRDIFQKRASQMGLEYYSPHKFRHFFTNETFKYAKNAEQIKAISQNLGHEKIATTMYSYGAIDDYRLPNVIDEINSNINEAKKV